jgi:hypothetical protein
MTVIRKIISGGETGAERAALDVAIELGIPHGGWVPMKREAEDGPLPEKYNLEEMQTPGYPAHKVRNIKKSDGTLIVAYGRLRGESAYCRRMALMYHRPWVHVDLTRANTFIAAHDVLDWTLENTIEILHVTGPAANKDLRIYGATARLLKALFQLAEIKESLPPPERFYPDLPRTFERVERIIPEPRPTDNVGADSQIPHKEKSLRDIHKVGETLSGNVLVELSPELWKRLLTLLSEDLEWP